MESVNGSIENCAFNSTPLEDIRLKCASQLQGTSEGLDTEILMSEASDQKYLEKMSDCSGYNMFNLTRNSFTRLHSSSQERKRSRTVSSCKYCGKIFQRSSKLQIHERIHTGVRPFKCRFCVKTFAQAPNLQKHERIHTGDRPFTCRFCKKSFTQSSNLRKHERIHRE